MGKKNGGDIPEAFDHKSPHRDRRYLTPYPIPPLHTNIVKATSNRIGFVFPMQFSHVLCRQDRIRRNSFTREGLMELFVNNGGQFRPSLMATDEKSALSDFPNLLPIGQFKKTYIKDVDIPVSKQKLIEDLDKWDTFFRSAPTISQQITPEENSHLQSAINYFGLELGDYIIKNRIDPKYIIKFINDHDIVHHPKILSYIKRPAHRRKRQTADINTPYCQYRGNKTDAGFINFCTSCMTTTDLGKEKFPRYINEIVCNVEPCLTVNQNPHGACQENILHLTFLRRAPTGCVMIIQDTSFGQRKVLADLWETYTQRIRVGCSCKLDKRSRLKQTFGFGK
ncbi:uncharacterized protein LOC133201050 [Saccostrea echinata]|uniref:uncharacterized protein LOC133201050 n=1 Tax=Saccostrea echinata TaxID=191078 RepID=UPI002A7F676B|nr:uncharacterized protein LOC133201050 [Saccostrea echinata]